MSLPRLPKARVWLVGAAALVVATIGMLVWSQPVADAANCDNNGRTCRRGYFYNAGPYYSGHNLFTPPTLGLYANNVGELINMLGSRMRCVNPGQSNATLGVPQSDQNGSSSAFIVLTMLGEPPGTSKNRACVRWNEWKDIVNSYDAAGLIHYSEMHDFQCVNTAFSSDSNDVFYYDNCGAARSIVFYSQAGSPLYAIKRDCGNPVGLLNGLPKLEPPKGDLNPPTPADADSPPGYKSGDTSVYSSCTTISGHATDPARSSYAVPVTVTYRVGSTVIGSGTATASTSGSNLFTLNTPVSVRGSPDSVTVSATGRAYNGSIFALTNSPITIGPCLKAQPMCAGATVYPTALDPQTPYAITASIRYGSDAEAQAVLARSDSRFYVRINGPGVNTALSYLPSQITRSGSLLTVTTPQQPATGQTGSYLLGYGISGSFGAIGCGSANSSDPNPPTFRVTGKPYFSVKGGDVNAGAGIDMQTGGSCSLGGVAQNNDAGVVSWNRGKDYGYAGAGSQYGVAALSRIQDFASGQGSALAPSGASFGNTGGSSQQVSEGAGLYGGEFGAMSCVSNYFDGIDNSLVQSSQTMGTQTIPNCDGSNQSACRKTVYVNGDVYINGDIRFSGSYANSSQIPSFALVVRGNIYVAPSVKRLDGFYVAQPSDAAATNGTIYTCATSPSIAAGLNANLNATCNNDLTVNGAFVARQVWLLRTAGSVSGTPAETFNYSPEAWLSTPYGNGLNQGKADDYDSITGLPPVL